MRKFFKYFLFYTCLWITFFDMIYKETLKAKKYFSAEGKKYDKTKRKMESGFSAFGTGTY